MTERDPLGLSADQREISDLYQSGDMTMACPLCRAYECLPGCVTRIDWPDWLGNAE